MKFVPGGLIDNTSSLVQIMAWRWTGDKPLSEPMIIYWHTYASQPWWVRYISVLTNTIHHFNIFVLVRYLSVLSILLCCLTILVAARTVYIISVGVTNLLQCFNNIDTWVTIITNCPFFFDKYSWMSHIIDHANVMYTHIGLYRKQGFLIDRKFTWQGLCKHFMCYCVFVIRCLSTVFSRDSC